MRLDFARYGSNYKSKYGSQCVQALQMSTNYLQLCNTFRQMLCCHMHMAAADSKLWKYGRFFNAIKSGSNSIKTELKTNK